MRLEGTYVRTSEVLKEPGLGNRLDPFDAQNSYLRVPGHSGRTSPSVASNSSEPESCIDDRYQDDDDVDIEFKEEAGGLRDEEAFFTTPYELLII
ncbi:hypothetical protein TELCIR_01970 [Teladorsagia circumcincta]|uniref:Uncharacterized protein n=1 Tax=Teladorsagia circumcincta TaxID=45464 RepID=A0A2G9V0E8_TELCI|nr:hypothetical protein TELCIR_01970 [Teladorsagia circumcincta]